MKTEKDSEGKIPKIGLGTARMKGKECISAVRSALELGYRHIDTAQMYGNENEVGKAVRESSVNREEIFLTTKVRRKNLEFSDLIKSFNESLERLDVDYVDLLLIHAPSKKVPVSETLQAMNRLSSMGKIENIGVSNFTVNQLEEAIQESKKPIMTNQVKYNPFDTRGDLLEYCRENDILLTAHTPLAKGKVGGNEVISGIAENHGKTNYQIALKWLAQKDNVVAIPKSARKSHIRENRDIFSFRLTEEEMNRIDSIEPGFLQRLKTLLA